MTAAVVQMRKVSGVAAEAVPRPPVRWHGGKFRLAPWIIAHFPADHTCYVEPFGGGASVLLQKPRLPAECYNDLDGTVVNLFRVLRDPQTAAELRRRIELTPYARAEFEWSYAPASDAIDAAHKVIVRSFMGFGSDSVTRGCRTGFRARMTDTRAFASAAWRTYAPAIDIFTRRLMGVVIEQVDALALVDRYDTPATLFYCDPPYLHETRSSLIGRDSVRRSGQGTHGYRHEMTAADHQVLLARLKTLQGGGWCSRAIPHRSTTPHWTAGAGWSAARWRMARASAPKSCGSTPRPPPPSTRSRRARNSTLQRLLNEHGSRNGRGPVRRRRRNVHRYQDGAGPRAGFRLQPRPGGVRHAHGEPSRGC